MVSEGRHPFPVYARPGEYPEGRAEWETKWLFCDHPRGFSHPVADYFNTRLETCVDCNMPRFREEQEDGICTHVEWELTGELWGELIFSAVTHPA